MEQLIKIFKDFIVNEADGSSPLYSYWSKEIIGDETLLRLIKNIPQEQPKPNLFFGAVQYIATLKGHALHNYFENPKTEEQFLRSSFERLKEFCEDYEAELIACFQTKIVQTNEVNRAIYLYPIFSEIAQRTQSPLSLMEIGTSAGLLLNLDHYNFEVVEQEAIKRFGDPNSELTLRAENRGDSLPNLTPFTVQHRIGIDLNILDLRNKDDFCWLNALIWPEHLERKNRLKSAREINNKISKELHEGDFLGYLPKKISMIDKTSKIVIFHTHVANQFSMELKSELVNLLQDLSMEREIYHVYNNMYDRHLHVDRIKNREITSLKTLPIVDGHGKYFSWC